MSITYTEPEFRNFGEDYKGRTSFRSKLEVSRAKHSGLFVMCAKEEVVRVYALADAYKHAQILEVCGAEGKVLGGGNISFRGKTEPILVRGESGDFGSLPNRLLEEYFGFFGYKVKAEMLNEGETKRIRSFTREFLKNHGVEI